MHNPLQDDLVFLRARTKKHEIMVAPGDGYVLVVSFLHINSPLCKSLLLAHLPPSLPLRCSKKLTEFCVVFCVFLMTGTGKKEKILALSLSRGLREEIYRTATLAPIFASTLQYTRVSVPDTEIKCTLGFQSWELMALHRHLLLMDPCTKKNPLSPYSKNYGIS